MSVASPGAAAGDLAPLSVLNRRRLRRIGLFLALRPCGSCTMTAIIRMMRQGGEKIYETEDSRYNI